MGREDDIQEGAVAQAPPQQQQQQQLKQAQGDAKPPSKQARVEKGDAGTGGGAVTGEADKAVTRIDSGALDQQESLESMRESNAPIKGDELYREAVPAGTEEAEAGKLLVEQERSASASKNTSAQSGQQQQSTGAAKDTSTDSSSKRARDTTSAGTDANAEQDKAVTRIDSGALDQKESLESMRESNAPITGDKLYKEAVPAGTEEAEAAKLLVEQQGKSTGTTKDTSAQGGAQQGGKDSSKSGTPGSPSKRAKVSSPKGTTADSGVSKPVTRIDSGTLDKQESLESMRASNAPHTGEQLYEDAVPAAEGTVNKPKGRGTKRSSR